MEPFSLTQGELDALIQRAESGMLIDGDVDIIKAMANAVKSLSQAVDDKATFIKKLLKMIFGSKTEKKKPGRTISFTGQAPINATVYDLEKLRCNLCGKVFISGRLKSLIAANSPLYGLSSEGCPLIKVWCI